MGCVGEACSWLRRKHRPEAPAQKDRWKRRVPLADLYDGVFMQATIMPRPQTRGEVLEYRDAVRPADSFQIAVLSLAHGGRNIEHPPNICLVRTDIHVEPGVEVPM